MKVYVKAMRRNNFLFLKLSVLMILCFVTTITSCTKDVEKASRGSDMSNSQQTAKNNEIRAKRESQCYDIFIEGSRIRSIRLQKELEKLTHKDEGKVYMGAKILAPKYPEDCNMNFDHPYAERDGEYQILFKGITVLKVKDKPHRLIFKKEFGLVFLVWLDKESEMYKLPEIRIGEFEDDDGVRQPWVPLFLGDKFMSEELYDHETLLYTGCELDRSGIHWRDKADIGKNQWFGPKVK